LKLSGKVIVVTAAGAGIGRAIAKRVMREMPAGLVLADLDATAVESVAGELGALAVRADAGVENDVRRLVDAAHERYGRVDVFVANAGVMRGRGLDADEGGPFADDGAWRDSWSVNVMAHVYATRALLPEWLERRSGCFVSIASAAGLLSEFGSQAYTVTKHAAVGFAEWLAITYAGRGVHVACVCPLGVETPMVTGERSGVDHLLDAMIPPTAVADALVEGLDAERFLVLPHPQVHEYVRRKADDTDRWINGMRRYRESLYG
jgi:NAD(P)-dependent dehydrogenase (short-subunit alcohol dehydrogenase family)